MNTCWFKNRRFVGVLTVVMGIMSPAVADEIRFRLKVPNPFPRIAKEIGKAHRFVIRQAERIERAVDEAEAEERRPPRPPPMTYSLDNDDWREPLPPYDPRDRESDPRRYYDPPPAGPRTSPPPDPVSRPQYPYPYGLIYDSARTTAPPRSNTPAPLPSAVGAVPPTPGTSPPPLPSGGTSTMVPLTSDRAHRPLPPSGAGAPSASVPAGGNTAPARQHPPAPLPETSKPAPPPEPAYGKPVPGRPGLVYPPGMKEAPENMIDVRGISPGTKVRDPATKLVFRVP